jgi:hypothetical protein
MRSVVTAAASWLNVIDAQLHPSVKAAAVVSTVNAREVIPLVSVAAVTGKRRIL